MVDIIDGKECANELKAEVKSQIEKLGYEPTLVIVQVGRDEASKIYVKQKLNAATKVGIVAEHWELNDDISENRLISIIQEINHNPIIDGVIVQLPLPKQINPNVVINTIDPLKDVDGFTAINQGLLWAGEECLAPCTPMGITMLLQKYFHETYHTSLQGADAVVVGRSNIVGKPVAAMLLQNNMTVTMAHSKTVGLQQKCSHAKVIIAAAGVPKMIDYDYVNLGSVIIDVGIHRDEDGKIIGDVDPEVDRVIRARSPVPGGVGPMTVACLMYNTLRAYHFQKSP